MKTKKEIEEKINEILTMNDNTKRAIYSNKGKTIISLHQHLSTLEDRERLLNWVLED